MQPAHRLTAAVVVVVDAAAAAAVPKSQTEGPTEEPKPTATACTSLCTTTAVLAIASATAESVGSYHIDVSADQIVLLGSSHTRLGFSLSKKARAGSMRYR